MGYVIMNVSENCTAIGSSIGHSNTQTLTNSETISSTDTKVIYNSPLWVMQQRSRNEMGKKKKNQQPQRKIIKPPCRFFLAHVETTVNMEDHKHNTQQRTSYHQDSNSDSDSDSENDDSDSDSNSENESQESQESQDSNSNSNSDSEYESEVANSGSHESNSEDEYKSGTKKVNESKREHTETKAIKKFSLNENEAIEYHSLIWTIKNEVTKQAKRFVDLKKKKSIVFVDCTLSLSSLLIAFTFGQIHL